MTEISVIVPARDAAATLPATLAALAAQDVEAPFEVIVVDDGSRDATAAVARAAPLEATVVERAGSRPGPARNAGVAASSGAVLAFTDADCVPEPGWLRAGIEALAAADLVQGAVRPDPAAARMPFDRSVSVDGKAALYETANLFCRRDLFDRARRLRGLAGHRCDRQAARRGRLVRVAGAPRRRLGRVQQGGRGQPRGLPPRRARVRVGARPARLLPRDRREDPRAAARAARRRRCSSTGARRRSTRRRWAPRSPSWRGRGRRSCSRRRTPRSVAADARRWRRRGPLAAVAGIAADAVGAAALVAGSLRSRSPVL